MLAFGIPGLKELVLVGLVALALYGRGGSRLLMATRHGRALQPWLTAAGIVPRPGQGTTSPASASAAPAPVSAPRRGYGRLFWVLTISAAAAVAAWVATRMVVMSGSGIH